MRLFSFRQSENRHRESRDSRAPLFEPPQNPWCPSGPWYLLGGSIFNDSVRLILEWYASVPFLAAAAAQDAHEVLSALTSGRDGRLLLGLGVGAGVSCGDRGGGLKSAGLTIPIKSVDCIKLAEHALSSCPPPPSPCHGKSFAQDCSATAT